MGCDHKYWSHEYDDEYVEPSDDDDFNADDISGYGDGDWPISPQQSMMEWVPQEIQRKYGRIESNMINGDWLELDPSHTAEIVAALQALGYTCTQNKELIAGCSG